MSLVNVFSYVFTMFLCFHYDVIFPLLSIKSAKKRKRNSTIKTGEYVKEPSLSFPKLKTELKTPTGSFFIVVFV